MSQQILTLQLMPLCWDAGFGTAAWDGGQCNLAMCPTEV